ncbi:endo-1,4-beta-xylanase, partial [candidate division KSB1 bacterium]|nr:endo-1,4-beta-xylanase [candidate division KSB1 bacterium]
DAQLYYNDYNFWKPGQCQGVIRLMQNLQSHGIRIDGIGIQGHWGLDYPSREEIETFISALSRLNVKLMITELDVTVLPFAEEHMNKSIASLEPELQRKLDPYKTELPFSVEQEQAKRYAEFFSIFRKHRDKFSRVTFWGIHDRQSWRSDWPVIGRTDYPLLFDKNSSPKLAFAAILKTGQSTS